MVAIISKLIEDSPKLSPKGIKQICSDFETVANRKIQQQIDKSLFKIFGVSSSYDIPDCIVNVANEFGSETDYTKCYYDLSLIHI